MEFDDTVEEKDKQEKIEGLYNYLAHGDDDHKSWLREAIEAYFNNKPKPEIRGSGNKEKLIAELQERIQELEDREYSSDAYMDGNPFE